MAKFIEAALVPLCALAIFAVFAMTYESDPSRLYRAYIDASVAGGLSCVAAVLSVARSDCSDDVERAVGRLLLSSAITTVVLAILALYYAQAHALITLTFVVAIIGACLVIGYFVWAFTEGDFAFMRMLLAPAGVIFVAIAYSREVRVPGIAMLAFALIGYFIWTAKDWPFWKEISVQETVNPND